MRTLLLATSLLATTAAAQQTSAWTIANLYGVGCQGNYAFLTNGVEAAGNVMADYDASTGLLDVTVFNTSPVISGQANPTIEEVHLNLPPGAVQSATLINQVGSGGATPAFTMVFDDDTAAAPDPNATACLGSFNISLFSGASTGIANENAPFLSAPNPVIGPVTFTIQLAGTGVSGIEAETIMATTSQGGQNAANVGFLFENGGASGQENGYLGACDVCRTAMYTVGDRTPGGSFELKVTGTYGCHACVWVSETEGPFYFGNIVVPIGLPITQAFTLGNFGLTGGNAFGIPVQVPNDPGLSGFKFYSMNVTYNALDLQGYAFSPAYTVRID